MAGVRSKDDKRRSRTEAPEIRSNRAERRENKPTGFEALSAALSFHWIEQASKGLDQVYTGMRRNLLRNLSLDAYATQLVSG